MGGAVKHYKSQNCCLRKTDQRHGDVQSGEYRLAAGATESTQVSTLVSNPRIIVTVMVTIQTDVLNH
jgi:hypothetical protein